MTEEKLNTVRDFLTWAEKKCQNTYSAKYRWALSDNGRLRRAGFYYNDSTRISLSNALYEKLVAIWPTRQTRWQTTRIPLTASSIVARLKPGAETALKAQAAEHARVEKIQRRNTSLSSFHRKVADIAEQTTQLIDRAQKAGFVVSSLADIAALVPEEEKA